MPVVTTIYKSTLKKKYKSGPFNVLVHALAN